MHSVNQTAYVRVPFEVMGDLGRFDSLLLRMKYDDGFVAYINGTEVAKGNAPNSVTWDSGANGSRNDGDATAFADFDITQHADSIRQGENVLAIHGFESKFNQQRFPDFARDGRCYGNSAE